MTKNDAKIINLKNHTAYRSALNELISQINNIASEIDDNLFNLACLKMWKEWDLQQPIGTEFYVTEEMLRNTGDKNIDLLWEVRDKISEVCVKIQGKMENKKDECRALAFIAFIFVS